MKNDELKSKHLDSITIEHVLTETSCVYNSNTDHITISVRFRKSRGYSGRSKTNKSCATWLGDRTEMILMNMFNHVEKMPINNPGYDFKCGQGYMVDAKSGCLVKNRYSWSFDIRRNTTPDFFLCLGFDNRQDLNPLHVWMIPGHVLNHLKSASISKSTLDK